MTNQSGASVACEAHVVNLGQWECLRCGEAVTSAWLTEPPPCRCDDDLYVCSLHPLPSAPTSEAVESALLDEESPVYTAVAPRTTPTPSAPSVDG